MADRSVATDSPANQGERHEYIDSWRDEFVDRHLLAPKRDVEEAEVVRRLTAVLERSGWQCQHEVPLPSVRLRPDIVIRHSLLPFPGIVECKAQIREPAQATAALKQASDYVGKRQMGGARR